MAYPPQPGYGAPPQGYPPQGYPPQGYPPQGYPPQGYPPQGYPPQGAYGMPMGYQAPNPLKQWFDAVDRDHSGRIGPAELQQALAQSGQTFSVATCERMINMFDRDKSSQISFDEFGQLNQFIGTMQTGFRQRDKSGDGRLEGPEVRAALQDSGFQLAEGTFQVMMRKFDRQRRGSLALDDYIELSIFISTVRNTFGFYDKAKTGQVTFSFDMFLAASVNTY